MRFEEEEEEEKKRDEIYDYFHPFFSSLSQKLRLSCKEEGNSSGKNIQNSPQSVDYLTFLRLLLDCAYVSVPVVFVCLTVPPLVRAWQWLCVIVTNDFFFSCWRLHTR